VNLDLPLTAQIGKIDADFDVERDPFHTVVTANIWNTFGPWDRRRGEFIDQMSRIRPTAICLQEVVQRSDYAQVDELAAELAHAGLPMHAVYRGHPFGDGLLGNAILTREHPRDVYAAPLPVEEAGEATRVAVAVNLDGVCIVTVHLSPHARQAALRVRQCTILREFVMMLRSCCEDSCPVVLAGDFNCPPNCVELAALSDGNDEIRLRDCWRELVGDGGETWLSHNPFTADSENCRLDYVFFDAGGTAARPSAIRTFGDPPLGDTYFSDHLGVVVEITKGD
jgi:endonuclease/exonuclease/phosphatase family metal-dependent hydrolase